MVKNFVNLAKKVEVCHMEHMFNICNHWMN